MKRSILQSLKMFGLMMAVTILGGCANPISSETVQGTRASVTEARSIQPVGTPNGKKVLFDNAHGQTAGAADWVIDGAFSDFGNALAARGFFVDEWRSNRALTLADLTGWDVLVLPEANIPFKSTEQQALLAYVQQGGAVFFIADHYNADRNLNRWDAGEIFNGYRRGAFGNPTLGMSVGEATSAAMTGVTSTDWLGTNFGIRFRNNAIGDVNATDIVAPAQAFGITTGVTAVAMHAGATLAILDPTKAKGIVYLPPTTIKWASAVDQGVYNGGGRAEGPFVAVGKIGLGKAAFIGDSSPIEDITPKYKREDTGAAKKTYAGWQEVDDAPAVTQVVDWLAQKESYTAFNQVPGLTLDTPTSLLAMEDPASSTEPQFEPWSTPPAGYLWYDQSTFAAGSYKYVAPVGVAVSVSPSSVTLQPGLSQQFTATVTGSTNTAVTWSATAGTISASGLYTAPTTVGTYSVTAVSQADATKSATATVIVQSSVPTTTTENFDTGVKTAYATGTVTLSTGSWTLADALLGNTTADHKVGAQSVRVRNTGSASMNFNLTNGVGTVSVKHAVYSTDAASTWGLWYSTNSGSTWTQTGASVTTSSATLATANFTVNVSGTVRLQLRKTSGGTNRLNWDDVVISSY